MDLTSIIRDNFGTILSKITQNVYLMVFCAVFCAFKFGLVDKFIELWDKNPKAMIVLICLLLGFYIINSKNQDLERDHEERCRHLNYQQF